MPTGSNGARAPFESAPLRLGTTALKGALWTRDGPHPAAYVMGITGANRGFP